MRNSSGSHAALDQLSAPRLALRGSNRRTTRPRPKHGPWDLLHGLKPAAIEGLEGRVLFSGPAASLAAAYPNVVAGQTTYTFTVDYTDNTPIDVTTLGNANLNVVNPGDAFNQEPTLVSYNDTNPTSVVATYQFTAPGGAFTADDTGDYAVSALAYSPSPNEQGVADTDGVGVPAGTIGDLNLTVQSPPSAQLISSQQPFTVGSGPYDFTVNYSDATSIDATTLGNQNLEVTGPNGFDQVATYVPPSGSDMGPYGPNIAAIYQITPTGDTFDAADVGSYTVSMLPFSPEQSGVADVNGVGIAAGPIGTLNLASNNTFPPIASLDASNPPTASAGQTVCQFVIDYSGGAAIDTSTLGNSNIAVSCPSLAFNTMASYAGTLGTPDESSVQAIYQFSAPDGQFDSNDNATYDFSMLPYDPSSGPSGVADVNGNGVLPGYVGSFNLTVQDAPPDTTPPTAMVDPSQAPIAANQPFYDFAVDYSDNVAIDTTTLNSSNLIVTGPNGFNQAPQYIGVSSSNGGASVQAIYQIQADDGEFGASDNGTYTVSIQPYNATSPMGVADTSGNGVPAGVIGTFDFQVPPAPNLTLSNVVYTPGTYAPGGVIAVRATVTNTGNATGSPFTMAAGLSPTGDFNDQPSIVVLTTMTVNQSLAPGQSITVTLPNATIPTTTAPGSYYFGATDNYTPSQSSTTPGAPTGPSGPPGSSGSSGDNGNNNNNGDDGFESSTATIIVAAPTPAPKPAPIGGLNPNFGTGGIVSQYTGLTSTAAVAVQTDNKTVAVGNADAGNGNSEFGVTRFNINGSLDTTFGGTGTVFTSFGGNDQPVAVAVQPDGKIVVAGTSSSTTAGGGSSFAIARYNPDGSLDTTFGNGGMVITQFASGSSDLAQGMQLMANGQILIVGQSNAAGAETDFALARYNANGSLDTSFGNGGMVLTNFLGGDDSANALSINPNTGAILVAGSATNPASGAMDFAMARYTANGSLDQTFGTGGKVITTISGQDAAYGVAVTAAGKIVVVGATFTGLTGTGQSASSNFAVARYTANGILDKSFGTGGVTTVSFGQPALANQVQVNADGSLLVAGATAPSLAAIDPAHLEVALAEVTAVGHLDPTFGTGGKTILPLGASVSAPAPYAPRGSVPGDNAPSVGGSQLSQAAAALGLLSQQHAIVAAFGLLVVVATDGSNTVVAQVVPSSPELAESIQTTLPASVLGGTKGSAVVTLTNSGNQLATGAVTITLYASLDNSVDPGDAILATMAGKGLKLKAHASQALKMKFALPTSLSNGNYYVVAKVNAPASATGAALTANTAASRPVTIQSPFVNLTAPALATPSGLHAGTSTLVNITLTNAGNVPAAGTVSVKLFAAAGATPAAGDAVMGTQTLKLKLKPNASEKFVLKLAVPQGLAAGSYYFLAGLTPALSGISSSSLSSNTLAGATQMVVS